MTAFLVDMKAPGVEVRPLFQITGEAEFNEVFFTDVRMPDSARIGDQGEGWHVAVTTLMNERVSIGGAVTRRGGGPSPRPSGSGRSGGRGNLAHTPSPCATGSLRATSSREAFSMTNMRAAQTRKAGTPGPEGSVAKLAFAEENKRGLRPVT